ncbi:MAG: RcnB family protein, partial [Candidatus Accumulibacter sp.]|nr:RcnB family protein [Accumulibacter sp.]
MKHRLISRAGLIALLAAGTFAGTSALAAPPGPGKNDRSHQPSAQRAAPPPRAQHAPPSRRPPPPPPRSDRRRAPPPAVHFDDRHRGFAHDYFRRTYVRGACPPGLSRRGNVCARPGARAWTRGRAVPRNVIFYDVPAPLLVELPPPPRGHRYVRVAGDILLIAIG